MLGATVFTKSEYEFRDEETSHSIAMQDTYMPLQLVVQAGVDLDVALRVTMCAIMCSVYIQIDVVVMPLPCNAALLSGAW